MTRCLINAGSAIIDGEVVVPAARRYDGLLGVCKIS